MSMMITILLGLGAIMVLGGVEMFLVGVGVKPENTILGFLKRHGIKVFLVVGAFVAVTIGVLSILTVFHKMEQDETRVGGTLGMSRLDWVLLTQKAKNAQGHRVEYERAWLGDVLEVQHSEMQRHVSNPDSTLIRVYLPGPVDGSLYFEVAPNGETKEWTMPPTPPIFPKK